MSWFFDNLFKRGTAKSNDKKVSSYDTNMPETSSPQKVREGNESSAIQQRRAQAEDKKTNN
jgi:hypothetical protein